MIYASIYSATARSRRLTSVINIEALVWFDHDAEHIMVRS